MCGTMNMVSCAKLSDRKPDPQSTGFQFESPFPSFRNLCIVAVSPTPQFTQLYKLVYAVVDMYMSEHCSRSNWRVTE